MDQSRVPTSPGRSGIPPRSDIVLRSIDTYVRTVNYSQHGSDFENGRVTCKSEL